MRDSVRWGCLRFQSFFFVFLFKKDRHRKVQTQQKPLSVNTNMRFKFWKRCAGTPSSKLVIFFFLSLSLFLFCFPLNAALQKLCFALKNFLICYKKNTVEIAQTVATQLRQLHYSNNLSKKKHFLLLRHVCIRAAFVLQAFPCPLLHPFSFCFSLSLSLSRSFSYAHINSPLLAACIREVCCITVIQKTLVGKKVGWVKTLVDLGTQKKKFGWFLPHQPLLDDCTNQCSLYEGN